MQKAYPALLKSGLQILWQCGRLYYSQIKEQIPESTQGLVLLPFIEDMAAAYACASLVVARAGAITLAELVATQKPAVLVPSPNVAENHQYYNALSLAEKGCALVIEDKDVISELEKQILAIFSQPSLLAKMQNHSRQLEKNDACAIILKHILELVDSPC
jgi:UDP-N-acetylglucosamine--N-acetylmuramyl-(pentapeptide) pyrophosphoryl-undecaprenol N-acetylglucosamine transferase